MPNKLNIGCGHHFLPDWENIDFESHDPAVRKWDIRRGLPYAGNTFEIVYMSHVLEHLPVDAAAALLVECRRVLKPGGAVRVVVPDLETMAREYVAAAEDCKTWTVKRKTWGERDREKSKVQPRSTFYVPRSTGTSSSFRHQWATVFLLDQLTRTEPGGEMGKMIEACGGDVPDFIKDTLGEDWVAEYMPKREKWVVRSIFERIAVGLRWRKRAFCERVRPFLRKAFPGMADFVERWKIAAYLKSGERHQWMYDRCSLTDLLEQCGFVNPVILSHNDTDSGCKDVIKLDTTADGKPYKPGSVYGEGGKGGK